MIRDDQVARSGHRPRSTVEAYLQHFIPLLTTEYDRHTLPLAGPAIVVID